jgi:hypothetical protein
MKKNNKKPNPHCPVPGCQSKTPHVADPLVKELVDRFAAPDKMTRWVLAAMAELRDSICRDLAENKLFAWSSRLRQPEELYIRTLYVLFIATDDEVPHILSGDMPNSFSTLYAQVNKIIFEGRGEVLDKKQSLNMDPTSLIDHLNDGAHVAFPALQICVTLAQKPEDMKDVGKYYKHLDSICTKLNYMRGMFEGGKEKKHILAGVMNLHRPASYWNQKSKEAREGAAGAP